MPPLDSDTAFAPLTRETAEALLSRFTCLDRDPDAAVPDPQMVRQALLWVAQHSDYQIFGICADTIVQAEAALVNYLVALGYADKPAISPLNGAVYVKFNPKNGRCHVDTYTGEHRGVLVSCQSVYEDGVNETFGHLPLDLFCETGTAENVKIAVS